MLQKYFNTFFCIKLPFINKNSMQNPTFINTFFTFFTTLQIV